MPTTGLHLRIIDYSTPRFCHVTDEDFEYIVVVDRCRMNLGYVTYGSRPVCFTTMNVLVYIHFVFHHLLRLCFIFLFLQFRPQNEIPYLAQVHVVAGGSEAENARVARAEDVPIGAGQDGVGIGAGVVVDRKHEAWEICLTLVQVQSSPSNV